MSQGQTYHLSQRAMDGQQYGAGHTFGGGDEDNMNALYDLVNGGNAGAFETALSTSLGGNSGFHQTPPRQQQQQQPQTPNSDHFQQNLPEAFPVPSSIISNWLDNGEEGFEPMDGGDGGNGGIEHSWSSVPHEFMSYREPQEMMVQSPHLIMQNPHLLGEHQQQHSPLQQHISHYPYDAQDSPLLSQSPGLTSPFPIESLNVATAQLSVNDHQQQHQFQQQQQQQSQQSPTAQLQQSATMHMRNRSYSESAGSMTYRQQQQQQQHQLQQQHNSPQGMAYLSMGGSGMAQRSMYEQPSPLVSAMVLPPTYPVSPYDNQYQSQLNDHFSSMHQPNSAYALMMHSPQGSMTPGLPHVQIGAGPSGPSPNAITKRPRANTLPSSLSSPSSATSPGSITMKTKRHDLHAPYKKSSPHSLTTRLSNRELSMFRPTAPSSRSPVSTPVNDALKTQVNLLKAQSSSGSMAPPPSPSPGTPGSGGKLSAIPLLPLAPMPKKEQPVGPPLSQDEQYEKLDADLLRADFDDITVSELKDMLRARGLQSSGKKAVLVERLKDEIKLVHLRKEGKLKPEEDPRHPLFHQLRQMMQLRQLQLFHQSMMNSEANAVAAQAGSPYMQTQAGYDPSHGSHPSPLSADSTDMEGQQGKSHPAQLFGLGHLLPSSGRGNRPRSISLPQQYHPQQLSMYIQPTHQSSSMSHMLPPQQPQQQQKMEHLPPIITSAPMAVNAQQQLPFAAPAAENNPQ
ncbi:uncharacterized protein EV422DRAFT_416820 [Fimicolochytrium jonesii]|uniref:uncharacterized protein n=1 Tax=Fimicolochytrium jonesii TaxID=1396493 RepID=UPI0022FF3307|nr:uncharacterized protein EV422DRAFT_416820 [Fimicolochytrium jonesii]KAI8822094.1 hypothetical protein EV422DRAFT_416820 [Fimicolochytrium jonesii]